MIIDDVLERVGKYEGDFDYLLEVCRVYAGKVWIERKDLSEHLLEKGWMRKKNRGQLFGYTAWTFSRVTMP